MSFSSCGSGDASASPRRSSSSSAASSVMEEIVVVGELGSHEARELSDNDQSELAAAPAALSFWKESRVYLNIAWPIVVSNLCMTGMGLTDISVLGNYDGNDTEHVLPASFSNASNASSMAPSNTTVATEYLAAASLGQIWQSLSSVVIWQGFAAALSVLASTAFGAGNLRLVGIWLFLTVVACSILCIPIGLTWIWAGEIMGAISDMESNLRRLVTIFSDYMLIGLMPQQLYCCLNLFLVAQGVVLPQVILSATALAGNFGFNFFYIYGIPSLGFEGLGFPGSPLATSSSQWFRLCGMILYLVCYRRKYAQSICFNRVRSPSPPPAKHEEDTAVADESASPPRPSKRSFCQEICMGSRVKEYLKQAVPLALTGVLEEGQIQVIAIMASHLSTEAIATHNALLSIVWFLTSAMWAISSTTRVRISHHLGAGDVPAAKQVIRISLLFGGGFGVAVACCFIFGRNFIGHIYSNDPVVWSMSAEIALLVGVGYALMTFFYVCMGTLAAQGRTTMIAIAFVAGAWGVAVPCAYVFAFKWHLTLGLQGLWLGLIAGYAVVSAIAVGATCRSNWGQIVVEAAKRSERHAGGDGDGKNSTISATAVGDSDLTEQLLQDPVAA